MMRKYDDEFKRQAVNKVFDGQSVASVSRELGVAESLLHKWKKTFLQNGNGSHSAAEVHENLTLKKRIKELEMEVEILKKATLIFGRGS
jgi:transposase